MSILNLLESRAFVLCERTGWGEHIGSQIGGTIGGMAGALGPAMLAHRYLSKRSAAKYKSGDARMGGQYRHAANRSMGMLTHPAITLPGSTLGVLAGMKVGGYVG